MPHNTPPYAPPYRSPFYAGQPVPAPGNALSTPNAALSTEVANDAGGKGLVDWAMDAMKERAPELGANAAATRSNFSKLGKLFREMLKAPLSAGITVVCAAVSAATRGEGTIGSFATRLALGAAHATVADVSRPAEAETVAALPADVVEPGSMLPSSEA